MRSRDPSWLQFSSLSALQLPERIAGGVPVRHPATTPHIGDVGSGIAADEADIRLRGKPRRSRPGLMELRAFIRQIAQGHQIAHPSAELRLGHCRRFAAASIRAMTIASMLLSDLMDLRLNFSASSRR